MAVQVPKLNRFEPAQTPSVGRSELQVPNLAAAVQPQQKAFMNVAEQQAEYFLKQEEAVIDTAANAASNEYQIYLNQELNKARLYKGDPTSIYNDYDENSAKKFEEILNKNPNLSERGKAKVNAALSEVATNFKIKKDTAYSGQYYEYDRNVTKSAAELTAQDFMTAASYVNPEDEKSFQSVDLLIRRIGNLYKTHGEKFGAVQRDEAGNQIATPEIELEIAKTTSDGLVAAIQNLNDSGRPDLADAMFAKYYRYIDVKKQDDVSKNIRKEKQSVKIYNAVDATVGMSPDKVDVFLNKQFKDDPEGREKAYEAIDARSRRQTNYANRVSDKSYNQAFDIVSSRMSGESPFTNIFEMENDPAIKKLLNTITKPSQKRALQHMVESPSKSDADTYTKNLELAVSGGYAGMSVSQFNEAVEGLNSRDRKSFEAEFKKQKQDTESAQRTRTNDAWNKLYRKFENGGFVKKKDGKVTKSSQEFLARVQTKFLQSTQSYTKNMSQKDIDDLNNQIYDEEVKLKANQPKSWLETIRSFWSDKSGNPNEREIDRKPYFPSAPNSPLDPNVSKSVPKAAPAPVTDVKTGQVTSPVKTSLSTMQSATDAFKKEKGRLPESSAELKTYMKEKGL